MMTIALLCLLLSTPFPVDDGASAAQHYLRASYYLQNGDAETALHELDAAITANSRSPHLHLVRGRCLQILGRTDDAQAAYTRAIELDPDNAEPHRALGILLLGRQAEGKGDEANVDRIIEHLKIATERDQRDIESRIYLAQMYGARGKQLEKYEVLKSAAEVSGNDPSLLRLAGDAAREIGQQRESNGHYAKAMNMLQRLAARGGENLAIFSELGSLSLRETRAYDVAAQAYARVIELAGREERLAAFRIEGEIGRASALFSMEDYQAALPLFRTNETFVLTRFRESIPALLLTYAHAGEIDRAEVLLQSLSGNTKSPAELLAYLRQLRGSALAAAGKIAEAAAVFNEVIAADPSAINAWLQLCQLSVDSRAFEEAYAVLDRAAEHFGSDHEDLVFMRAVIHERAGRYDEALDLLTGLIDRDPDNHLALNFAGYTLAELDRDLDTARSWIQRALELEPHQGSYLDSLGWIYYKQGDFASAEKYLLLAQKTKYRDPVIREHLGFVFRALNKDREALAEFQAAIEFNLANEKPVDEVRRQINELRALLDKNR